MLFVEVESDRKCDGSGWDVLGGGVLDSCVDGEGCIVEGLVL